MNVGHEVDNTDPNESPLSPCSNFIFSDSGRARVSAPIANIAFTSSMAP